MYSVHFLVSNTSFSRGCGGLYSVLFSNFGKKTRKNELRGRTIGKEYEQESVNIFKRPDVGPPLIIIYWLQKTERTQAIGNEEMQLGMEMDAIGAELKGIAGASTEAFVSPSYLGPECLLTKCYRRSSRCTPLTPTWL